MLSRDPSSIRRVRPRRRLAAAACAVVLVATAAACSSDEPGPAPTGSGAAATQPGSTALGVGQMTDEQRVAEAKTQAVGYFEALATLDYGKAEERSSGSAAIVVAWTKAVNAIQAVKATPYEIKAIAAPNVRVQFDRVTESGGSWTASGFVELGYRPGPVTAPASTVPPTTGPGGSVLPNTNVFVTDFVFTADGEHLEVDDYRLDDTPYPVSQLFVAAGGADARATEADVEATLTYAHRDFDGSVQYLTDVHNGASGAIRPTGAAFEPKDGGASKRVRATLLADELAPDATSGALIVLPGAFPGVDGTVILEVPVAPASTGSTIPGTTAGSSRELRLVAPPWPTPTPRPLNSVKDSQSTKATTTTSATTTTAVPAAGATTTSAPGASTTTLPTTTTTGPASTSTTATTRLGG
jgi:hypothetical protein